MGWTRIASSRAVWEGGGSPSNPTLDVEIFGPQAGTGESQVELNQHFKGSLSITRGLLLSEHIAFSSPQAARGLTCGLSDDDDIVLPGSSFRVNLPGCAGDLLTTNVEAPVSLVSPASALLGSVVDLSVLWIRVHVASTQDRLTFRQNRVKNGSCVFLPGVPGFFH